MSQPQQAPAFIPPSATVTDFGIGPKANAAREQAKQTWSVVKLDRLTGGRGNRILVMVANPKKPGSMADRNWPLYGKTGEPTVTVEQFLKNPAVEGGLSRARVSLAYDLNYGYVKIIDAAGNVVTP